MAARFHQHMHCAHSMQFLRAGWQTITVAELLISTEPEVNLNQCKTMEFQLPVVQNSVEQNNCSRPIWQAVLKVLKEIVFCRATCCFTCWTEHSTGHAKNIKRFVLPSVLYFFKEKFKNSSLETTCDFFNQVRHMHVEHWTMVLKM